MMQSNEQKNLIGAVMVCGGGIAGIQSSLDLANSGYKVYMVEKSPSIGGKMAQLDKTFPTGDCATCVISPKLVEAVRNLNIEILTQSEIEEMDGEPGNFRVKIRQKARYVDIAKCNSCGDCQKVCPVRVPDGFNRGLSVTTAIRKVYPQAAPNAFLIEKGDGKSPCKTACPAGVNAHGYVALIAKGKFAEALALERQRNPFPAICGRICNHPCEDGCLRKGIDGAIAICGLKRFLSDYELEHGMAPPPEVKEKRPEKVAVIGAGPAGLTAAYDLALMGYGVTVFEASSTAGGMLSAAIPEYRLPREAIQADVEYIRRSGVEIVTNTRLGEDISLDDLREKGFGAALLAVGASRGRMLNIPGADLTGVVNGLDFLRDVSLGKETNVAGRVVVIGGGSVAMDVARTAVRLGARSVRVACIESREEMPAHKEEVAATEAEILAAEAGPASAAKDSPMLCRRSPARVTGENGRVTGIEFIRVKHMKFDEEGRLSLETEPGTEMIVPADTVIMAIGQATDAALLEGMGLRLTGRGAADADPVTMETNLPGVFAAGDLVSGPSLAVMAIGAGHEAATSIDRYLRGEDLREGRKQVEVKTIETPRKVTDPQPRIPMPEVAVAERIRGFAEVELGYTEEMAVREAERCLHCEICSECQECVKACGAKAIDHDEQDHEREIEVGAIILAPGYEEFDARLRGEFGFGRYKNVVTNVQFERMLSASGPFGGHLQRLSDGREPKRIAFIQCVGSRDAMNGRAYCSSVCCMAAIKEAVVARSHVPELETTIFYTDIRAFGKDFDRYYERAKADGVRFVRSTPSRIVEVPGSKDLRISHIRDGQPVDEEFDLVVLSTGIRPSDEALRTAAAVGVELNECGFCKSDEAATVATSRQGVYVAGAFQEPKDIPETVAQASAAAAMAMELLSPARGTMVTEKIYPPEHDFTDAIPRIGVFVCHCGINISSVVDVERVVEAAGGMPFVAHAESNIYTCADNTQQRIKDLIEEHNLNRLVVASCTPRTHEPLFRETARECGLNPFLVDMANIRDQCSWVHSNDHEAATEKSIDLVRMAVARTARLGSLITEDLPVIQSGLVLGGGPSGMTAALSLANQGYRTHLVEKSDKLGGRLAGATRDDLSAKIAEHPLITVYLSSQLVTLQGHVGNFLGEVKTPDGIKSVAHGALLIATGGIERKPEDYLYGKDSRVMTQRELEDKLAAGSLNLPERAVVGMIQCVGSRNEERPYCSRSCCTEAVRNAIRVKEMRPDANVVVLYRDMRTYGANELYYQKAREMGVIFIRYEPDAPPEVTGGEKPVLRFVEPELGLPVQLSLDLLALSTGTSPALDNKEVSDLAKIPLNNDGFFLEAHVKLRPVDFASEGIFLCGSAHSPKTTAENMQQGRAAAGRAATILSKKSMTVGGMVSQVDVRKCVSCLTCVRLCPFGAPEVSPNNGKNRVEIQVAKCMGCGSCASECPAKAIQLSHFMDAQVAAAIEALLEVTV
ncbi:MAG: FAD-dependent oxidoreductase [Armatimonadota bacterium]|nr:FAD-dependent oxidoreductase [Armatimonadota bacterium]